MELEAEKPVPEPVVEFQSVPKGSSITVSISLPVQASETLVLEVSSADSVRELLTLIGRTFMRAAAGTIYCPRVRSKTSSTCTKE